MSMYASIRLTGELLTSLSFQAKLYVTVVVKIVRMLPPARHAPSAVTGGHAVMPSLSAMAGHAVESVPPPVLHISAPTGIYESYRISWFGVWKAQEAPNVHNEWRLHCRRSFTMMGLSSTMAAAKCLRYKLPCHMHQFEKVSIQCVVESTGNSPGISMQACQQICWHMHMNGN